jgi:hypothetical protein
MKNADPFPIPRMAVMLSGVVLLLAQRCFADEPNVLTEAEQKAGWKLLFDGKTTNGWRSFRKQDIHSGWKVIDGALTRVGNDAGYIVTVDKYGSFELSLEFNISRGGNSGVMFHVTEEYELPWMSGPEVQIVDNKEGHDPQLSGWLYDLYPATVDATRPPGQWNHLRIIVTPQKSETYMNGVKYCEYALGSKDWDSRVAKSKFAEFPEFGKATEGHIALQDHNAVVGFRNIKVRPLLEK